MNFFAAIQFCASLVASGVNRSSCDNAPLAPLCHGDESGKDGRTVLCKVKECALGILEEVH